MPRKSIRHIQGLRLDAAANAFIERQLEFVEAEAVRQPYPELLGRQVVPVTHRAPPGTETISYRIMDRVGIAQRIKSYSDNIPRADVNAREDRVPVHVYGMGYGYSFKELRAAAKAQVPLDAEKAQAARQGFELRVDLIAFNGNGEGLYGLLNLPNANSYVVPADGSGASALWTAKTEDLILRDLNGIATKAADLTNGVETPDTLLLPLAQFNLASVKRITNTQATVLEFFLRTNPYIRRVIPVWRCKGAGAGGTDRMVAYRADPSKVRLEIPMEFMFHTAQERGLGVEIPGEGEIAGVISPFPMSVTFGDGI